MAKTKIYRRTHRMSTTKKYTCKNQATMHGLTMWYTEMFEKLGWMVLAKSKGGMNDKIVSYKKSLERLRQHLECKKNQISEIDRKIDLEIMINNVDILISHARKDLRV